jgi:hypothetical protein
MFLCGFNNRNIFEVAAKSFWHSIKFRGEVKSGNKLNPAFPQQRGCLPE